MDMTWSCPDRRPRSRSRALALGVAVLGAGGLLVAVPIVSADATPSTGVVLNEVYGGGGNNGATYKNDFIELVNRGTAPVDLTGWSVQYAPASGTSWQVTQLSGSVAAGDSYLIAEGGGTNPAAPLPTAQTSGTINMSGTAGTVALVRSTTALGCHSSSACASDTSIVDLVGFGTSATIAEGTAAPAPSNTTSVNRVPGPDTDNNTADFTTATPTPTGSSAGGTPQPGDLRIHDIQGDSWVSPKKGAQVTNVPGIVTALRTSGSRGFWFQDPDPDSNAATSEGVFVYTGSMPQVAVGDSVLVSGKVSDYYPGSDDSNLSVTEIGSPSITTLSSGNALPAPIVLGPGNVPDTYAPDLGGKNIEDTPITPTRSVLDFYESIEGMRAEVDDAQVVGPSNKYGEQYVTTKPGQDRTYRGGVVLTGENKTPTGRLEIVTPDGTSPGVQVGDTFSGATVGPIDYSAYGGYTLVAAELGSVSEGSLTPVVARPGTAKQLSIATYNVENLSPQDSPDKFANLAQGVVENLGAPDVVALEEVQDNSGPTDDGTVDPAVTLNRLADAIVVAGGPRYEWRQIDPVDDQDGGQPGGNIRNAFLFDPSRVAFVDRGTADVDRSTTATSVVKSHGVPALTLSPGRIDPANPVWLDSRKPLVGQFRFGKHDVFVVANHFDSKGGDQNADGRYQYPERFSEAQRSGQAGVVHDFVDSILSVDKKADVVVLGDLNDYQFSPALTVLKTGSATGDGTPTLRDLITGLPIGQQYTYVYNGVSQVLDHIMVTPEVSGVRYQVVHVNAEFAQQTSDHDPQVVDITP